MAYATAVPDSERLPWLTDESTRAPKDNLPPLVLWSVLAAVLIAAASYWLGMTTGTREADADAPGPAASTTIALPEPSANTLVENVEPAPMPEVKPVAEPREVSLPTARSDRPKRRRAKRRSVLKSTPLPDDSLRGVVEKQEVTKPKTKKASTVPQLWPASISENAYGRVVRIGTFGSRYKAKRAWHSVMRAYPGMRRLKAVVVANPSLRNGRTYYRLQFGTSSQAHSAVLCQRMRTIGQSCVVVGLPGGVS